MNRQKQKAFTLVELIIVITILAIIGTIAFITFSGYISSARDVKRKTDIYSLEQGLGLYAMYNITYPLPSDYTTVTFSGSNIWYQGHIGNSLISSLKSLTNVPVDPLTLDNYSYSLTNNRKEYEVSTVFESPDSFSMVNNIYANDGELQTFIKGNYNKLITRFQKNGKNYIIALPSITASSLADNDLTSIINSGHLAYDESSNIPDSYKSISSSYTGEVLGLDINSIILFEGNFKDLAIDENQRSFFSNLISFYGYSTLIEKSKQIKHLSELDSESQNAEYKDITCNLINYTIKYHIECNGITFVEYYLKNYENIDISNLPSNNILAVYQTTSGEFWFGTDKGITYYDGLNWTNYNKENSNLLSNKIYTITEDVNGDMWFGTNQGINIFDGETFSTITTSNSELLHNHILSIHLADDGTMWIGTNKGVSSYNKEDWDEYNKKKGELTHPHVNVIFKDSYSNVWFGSDHGVDKMYSVDSNTVIEHYHDDNGLPSESVTYIFEDTSGIVWFGTNTGIATYNGSSFVDYFTTSDGLVGNFVTFLYEDSAGNIWIGTTEGISKYNGATFTNYDSNNGLLGNNIYSISEITGNKIQVVTDGGISIIE